MGTDIQLGRKSKGEGGGSGRSGLLRFFRMGWWHGTSAERQQSPEQQLAAFRAQQQQQQGQGQGQSGDGAAPLAKVPSLSSIAKALLVTRRRLRLDPDSKLNFLYEPGKQVSSAIKIKNTSRSPVAFKFQTNAPKSCFMRPPSGILMPGETIITTVFKFIEQPEPNQDKKCRDKFKIVSLKVKQGTEFTPELFEEQKEFVAVERVLRVIFLDPQGQSPEIEKLNKRLAEAEAAQEQRKKPPEEKTQKTGGTAGGVLDEWKEQQREKRLAKQQAEGGNSL